MPELPEVETVVRQLQRRIVGKTIKSVDIRQSRMVQADPAEWSRAVPKATVQKVIRRAKMVVIDLANPYFLGIHLKMTGQLVFVPHHGKIVAGGHPIIHPHELPNKFSHVIFHFTDGSHLYFNDTRQFGWVRLYNDEQLSQVFASYGVEPLTKDFTLPAFRQLLKRYPNRSIKKLLLDQSLIAGIGNIYADEAVFVAKVRPTRYVSRLTTHEISKIHSAIIDVLTTAVANKGTTSSDFITADGKAGYHAAFLNVYGRNHLPCRRRGCRGTIHKIVHAARGTHYCPQCQV